MVGAHAESIVSACDGAFDLPQSSTASAANAGEHWDVSAPAHSLIPTIVAALLPAIPLDAWLSDDIRQRGRSHGPWDRKVRDRGDAHLSLSNRLSLCRLLR